MPPEEGIARRDAIDPRAWRVLAVLSLVYVLNFVDRQLLTILAPDLKRDLGIGDSEFGFLYGTAFGVFYALFGIPLGKLADRWSRTRLLAIGLALWSSMTALSGLARNFTHLAVARIGVGVGEASATPCAYSLVGDYFPPHRRATALGIYSAGLYLGGGVSLFLGSAIAGAWNDAHAGAAPFGLAGWQVAFLAVGLPGLLLALVVARLAEPARGRFDPVPANPPGPTTWRDFIADVMAILPPFTLFAAARGGALAIRANLVVAVVIAVLMALMDWAVGDPVQWTAVGLGFYAAASWALDLRRTSPVMFTSLLRSRAFMGVTVGYSLISFIGYASTGFTPLYAIEVLAANPREAGLTLGAMGATGGVIGVIGGGVLTDRLAAGGAHGRRLLVTLIAAIGIMVCHAFIFTADNLTLFYPLVLLVWIFTSATLAGASGVIVNIVPAQARGTASAAFLLGTNLIGLALGPYTAGRLSEAFGDLGTGMVAMLAAGPAIVLSLLVAWRSLRSQA